MLVISTPLVYASAQETHEHADHSAVESGPAVSDPDLVVSRVEDGLLLPTAMAFVDENRILVLEKDNGTVRMIEDGVLSDEPVLDVAVANENERGMLGIAVSIENDTTFVFLYFTESGGGIDGDDRNGIEPAGNRLYRYELEGGRLVNPALLLDLPATPGPRYNGGPVLVGPDGFVYVVIGDVEGHITQAQNFQEGPAADGTSGVLRVGVNGEVPPSVIGTGVYGKYYYAYGIRNSFGMDFDPVTGKLWDTENGPASGDEINLVEPGFNSGWRDVFGMANETLDGLVLFNELSKYSDPELAWIEPIGPTALTFLDSDELGTEYENDMLVGDILNGAIYRYDLDENRTALSLTGEIADKVVDEPAENEGVTFASGFGGITDIKVGPDGHLYVLSFIDGTVFKISPEEGEAQPEPDTEPSMPPTRPQVQDNDRDRTIDLLTQRFALALDNDACFDEQDRRRLDNVISKIISDIFGENELRTNQLDRTLDRIIEDCLNGNGVERNDERRNNDGNNGRPSSNEGGGNDNRGRGNDDDEDDDGDDD
jgi:glucose/arabinose dehydrogenase